MSDEHVVGLVAVVCLFGAWPLWFIIDSLASNWRKARVAEQDAVLKREMIERGFTADEIERVIASGSMAGDKMAGKTPQPSGRR
jgi:hypothetical protein